MERVDQKLRKKKSGSRSGKEALSPRGCLVPPVPRRRHKRRALGDNKAWVPLVEVSRLFSVRPRSRGVIKTNDGAPAAVTLKVEFSALALGGPRERFTRAGLDGFAEVMGAIELRQLCGDAMC